MAWGATVSSMFREWPNAIQGGGGAARNAWPTSYGGLTADTVLVALYNDSVTPDKDATYDHTGYNSAGSQWVVANEVADGTNWDAGGEPLTGKAFTVPGSGIAMFDGADTPQGGASCTLANVYGCLVYDGTISGGSVVDQGITFHNFGGIQSVTAGTFTVVWHANGLFRITT